MKIRKFMAIILTAVLCIGLLPTPAYAAKLSGELGEYITWTLNGGTLTISGSGEGLMPNGSVSKTTDAFNKNDVTEIIVEEGVTSIGRQAFTSFSSVTSVSLPDTLTHIGEYAFQSCEALTSIELPEGLVEVESCAFTNCYSLERVKLPSSLTTISSSMFSSCTSLRTLEIPEGVTTIESYAFSRSGLEKVALPSTLTNLEMNAFANCYSLEFPEIPESVTVLENFVFSECDSFEEIVIPSHITKIGNSTFANCDNLRSVTVPSSVTEISYGAFIGCTALEEVYLPNTITEILHEVFRDCTSLRYIELPEGVTSVQAYAFSGCTSLEEIKLPSTMRGFSAGVFANCTSLKSFELPQSTGTVSQDLFNGCTALESIAIPAGFTHVGAGAFAGCTSLREVIYTGSEAEWADVYIDDNNEPLIAAAESGLVATGVDSTGSDSTEPSDPSADIERSPGSGAIEINVEDTVSMKQHRVMKFGRTGEEGFTFTMPQGHVTLIMLYQSWSEACQTVASTIANSSLVENDKVHLIGVDIDMVNEAGLRNFTYNYLGSAANKFSMYRVTQSRDLYGDYANLVGAQTATFPLVVIVDSGYYARYYMTGVNTADVYVDAVDDILNSEHGSGENTGPEYGIATNNGVNLKSGALDMPKLTAEEIIQLLTDNPITYPESDDVYEVEPSVKYPYKAGSIKREYIQEAVDRLSALRRIAGLPGVTLNEDLLDDMQHAVILLENDPATCLPLRPSDMDDEFYNIANSAVSSSNLAKGYTLTSVVDGFMNGSSGDIETLGSRRWQLNPNMGQTAFGYSGVDYIHYGGIVAEWALDRSAEDTVDYDFISWPASGAFPNGFLDSESAWSVSLNPDKFERPIYSKITVRLTRLEDNATWTFDKDGQYDPGFSVNSSSATVHYNKFFAVETSNYGSGPCIIFRPDDVDVYEGTYRVEIDGLEDIYGRPVEFGYEVEFFTGATEIQRTMFRLDSSKVYATGEPMTKDVISDLVEGVDYIVDYRNNVEPGGAQAIIMGIGNYTGLLSYGFFIYENDEQPDADYETGWVDSISIIGESQELPVDETDDEPEDGTAGGTEPAVTFTDVGSPDVWYYDEVYAAAGAGIIAGNADGTFAPDKNLSWAETVTFAVRIAQYNAGEPIYGAADQIGVWYQIYVNYAYEHGFITEMSSTPDAAITRGEAAQIFAAALGDAEQVNTVAGDYFTDVPPDSPAYDAVYTLARAGIVNGKLDTQTGVITFGTNDTFLRSEVATIVARMAGLVEKATIN